MVIRAEKHQIENRDANILFFYDLRIKPFMDYRESAVYSVTSCILKPLNKCSSWKVWEPNRGGHLFIFNFGFYEHFHILLNKTRQRTASHSDNLLNLRIFGKFIVINSHIYAFKFN